MSVLVLEPIGGVPEILADLVAKNMAALPGIGRWLANLVQRVTLSIGRTRWGRRMSQSTARKFPLGYFMVAEKCAIPSARSEGPTIARKTAHIST